MRTLLACFLTLAFSAVVGASGAQAASINGSWRGEGIVKLTSGDTERVRCRINYEESTGRTFVLHVSCAHTNGMFEQSGRIVQISADRYTGRIYNQQYGVAGEVSISVNGSRQTITARSPKGSATVNLTRQ